MNGDVKQLANGIKSIISTALNFSGEFDCELELVSSGICQLKHISQAFDDAIVKEERQQAISNYYYLMARNSQSVHRSLKPSQAIRMQAKKLHQTLGT
ncbi:hypothetical protein EK904_010843 [Melospiza melodia maxima]|nr:hypothetical protein EK904_010843 [Melospiza melodia maxima]